MLKIFTIALALGTLIKCEISESDSVYVDVQTKRYLLLEKSLWETISRSRDQNANIDNIYANLIKFYNETYSYFHPNDDVLVSWNIKKFAFVEEIRPVQTEWERTKEYIFKANHTSYRRNETISLAQNMFKILLPVWNVFHNASIDANYFDDVRQVRSTKSNNIILQNCN